VLSFRGGQDAPVCFRLLSRRVRRTGFAGSPFGEGQEISSLAIGSFGSCCRVRLGSLVLASQGKSRWTDEMRVGCEDWSKDT